MRNLFWTALSVAAALLPAVAIAAPITITNHSFESPVAAPSTFVGGMASGPTGWSVYNTGATNNLRFFGVWNPTGSDSFVNFAPDGSNIGVVFLQNTTNLAEAGLLQALTATLQANTQYTLTVEVGNFAPSAQPIPFNFSGFPGYRVDLLAGGVPIASDFNSLAPAEGFFETSTVSFTTGAVHANLGQQLAIRLVNLNGPGIEVNFDDVRLDASAVPAPAAAALVFTGLLGLGTRRRRPRRHRNPQARSPCQPLS